MRQHAEAMQQQHQLLLQRKTDSLAHLQEQLKQLEQQQQRQQQQSQQALQKAEEDAKVGAVCV